MKKNKKNSRQQKRQASRQGADINQALKIKILYIPKTCLPMKMWNGMFIIHENNFFLHTDKLQLEDLKVLKRSPDLINNVKIGQGQLRLII